MGMDLLVGLYTCMYEYEGLCSGMMVMYGSYNLQSYNCFFLFFSNVLFKIGIYMNCIQNILAAGQIENIGMYGISQMYCQTNIWLGIFGPI